MKAAVLESGALRSKPQSRNPSSLNVGLGFSSLPGISVFLKATDASKQSLRPCHPLAQQP